jgi:hypothetical protein
VSGPRERAPAPAEARARRLRAPLLVTLWALLAIEAAGGLVISFARLAAGATPGIALHVVAGFALALAWAAYQWTHWRRVAPWRPRLDYVLGLIGASSMLLALASGFALAPAWWNARGAATTAPYPAWLSGAHNVMSMFVLTFVGAHLFAVLQRAERPRP